jgi:hypothetical protein
MKMANGKFQMENGKSLLLLATAVVLVELSV